MNDDAEFRSHHPVLDGVLVRLQAERDRLAALHRELLANLDAEPFVGVFLGDVEDRIRAALAGSGARPAFVTSGCYCCRLSGELLRPVAGSCDPGCDCWPETDGSGARPAEEGR